MLSKEEPRIRWKLKNFKGEMRLAYQIVGQTTPAVVKGGESLSDDSTISDLKKDIFKSAQLDISLTTITSIKAGFPPKPVRLTNAGEESDPLLSSLGIRNGDKLIIEVGTRMEGNSSDQTRNSASTTVSTSELKDQISHPTDRTGTQTQMRETENSVWLTLLDGTSALLVVDEMKDDNSCLFHSISYLTSPSESSSVSTSHLRKSTRFNSSFLINLLSE
jgi:ubiquitin thioesterase OTU1